MTRRLTVMQEWERIERTLRLARSTETQINMAYQVFRVAASSVLLHMRELSQEPDAWEAIKICRAIASDMEAYDLIRRAKK